MAGLATYVGKIGGFSVTVAEMLIQVLHGVVNHFSFVPEAAIKRLADEPNLSRTNVHGVVSYYDSFRMERPAPPVIDREHHRFNNAASNSPMMSLTSSQPTETRIKLSRHFCG